MVIDGAHWHVSKQFHVGLGVFVAVWNVAASVIFSLTLVSEYTPGVVIGLLGVPFLLLGGLGRGIPISGAGFDAERTVGLGEAVIGTGVVVSMVAPLAVGSTESTDLLVAGLSTLAGGGLAAMGIAVAAGRIGLPGEK